MRLELPAVGQGWCWQPVKTSGCHFLACFELLLLFVRLQNLGTEKPQDGRIYHFNYSEFFRTYHGRMIKLRPTLSVGLMTTYPGWLDHARLRDFKIKIYVRLS
ncbi:hypothetical protein PUN28_020268 [Cardiocondyla obscurior]|uniref:Uncharacterized protein n=1 Tax=Cardiocondyla obscurior TaxID=286306 RepID=A0AAW2E9V1_9HYME